MARKPAGGVGSNQYGTKGVALSGHRTNTAQVSAAVNALVVDDDVQPEDVAWVFHPDYAAWEEAGINSAVDAERLASAGFTAGTFTVLAQDADLDVDEALKWTDQKFTPTEAVEWWDGGVGQPEVAREWADSGWGPDQGAFEWLNAGFTPSEAKEWANTHAAYGSRMIEASEAWRDAGFTPEQCEAWRVAGFSAEEAGMWVKHGVTAPDEYRNDAEQALLANGETPPV